jgi:hypothetical protein
MACLVRLLRRQWRSNRTIPVIKGIFPIKNMAISGDHSIIY